jgi:hypothetical protein
MGIYRIHTPVTGHPHEWLYKQFMDPEKGEKIPKAYKVPLVMAGGTHHSIPKGSMVMLVSHEKINTPGKRSVQVHQEGELENQILSAELKGRSQKGNFVLETSEGIILLERPGITVGRG